MHDALHTKRTRRPRFCRASEPPAFRVTDDDVIIIRLLARHRFLRSTHIAALVARSLDRTNDRLSRLFHAGYIDRPRAQLDFYPTSGSVPMVYALADLGALLLIERGGQTVANLECSRKNRKVGRPFIEHQLEVVDFYVALQLAMRDRADIRLIDFDELIAAFPEQTRTKQNPVTLRVSLSHAGNADEIGLIPDLIFGIGFPDGSRRCFMVEIDRGTMPILRSDFRQTSVARKMAAYLAVHATKKHEQHFGWKAFRVLVITTDNQRIRSMQEALRCMDPSSTLEPSLFFFASHSALGSSDPLVHAWQDGRGRATRLI
jgi:Replication-relaxation